MPLKARIYVWALATAGLIVIARAFSVSHSRDSLQFACYVVLAVMSSGLNVKLPGMDGTMSVNFLFVLIGIADLSFSETIAMGLAATIVQCFWRRKNPIRPIQVAFNLLGMMPLAIAIAYCAFVGTERYLSNSLPIMLLVTAGAYFLANTVPVGIAMSLAEGKRFGKTWAECYFWSFPYYLVGAAIAGLVRWANARIGWQTSLLILPAIFWVYRSYRLYLGRLEDEKRRVEDEKRHVEQMASLHLRTIEALAMAIDAKDHATHEHLQRVRVYAIEIAKELKVSEDDIEALRAAALLHDIGKLAVPEHILNKPGKLTPQEFEKMKIHPVVGAEILERVEFPYPVAPIVRAHHEKWNGKGYPYGLSGEQIPMAARILSVVDCLDALSSDRQYRRKLPLDDAMDIIVQGSGTDFDPAVVEVLHRRYRELEALAQAERPVALGNASNAPINLGVPSNGFAQELGKADDTHFVASIAAARQEAQMLFELSHDLGNSLSLDETLSLVAMRLHRLVPYDSIAIFIRRGDKLIPQYVGGENVRLLSALEIPVGEGVSGWVAQNQSPMINADPALEPGYCVDGSKQTVLRSATSVPLMGLNGIIGALTVYRTDVDGFTSDHVRVLTAINSKIAFSVENALKYEQAESSATTDYLTGLPNARSLFLHLDREVARCRRTGETLAVMVCDLNGFKAINDRFGHLEGNRVLQVFSHAAKAACREYDYVARMGGDEFVIVSSGMTREAAEQRQLLFDACAQAAGEQVCGEKLLSISIGAAFYPDDGSTPEALLDLGDKRMYAFKQARKLNRHGAQPVLSAEHTSALVN